MWEINAAFAFLVQSFLNEMSVMVQNQKQQNQNTSKYNTSQAHRKTDLILHWPAAISPEAAMSEAKFCSFCSSF